MTFIFLVFLFFLSCSCFCTEWQDVFAYTSFFVTQNTCDQHRTCCLGFTKKSLGKNSSLRYYARRVWHMKVIPFSCFTVTSIQSIQSRTRNSQKFRNKLQDVRKFKSKRKAIQQTKIEKKRWSKGEID